MPTEPDWQTFLETAIISDGRDWSENATDAWIYGIFVGWEGDIDRVSRLHSWTPGQVYSLELYRQAFVVASKGDYALRLATLEAKYENALTRIRLSELSISSLTSDAARLRSGR